MTPLRTTVPSSTTHSSGIHYTCEDVLGNDQHKWLHLKGIQTIIYPTFNFAGRKQGALTVLSI